MDYNFVNKLGEELLVSGGNVIILKNEDTSDTGILDLYACRVCLATDLKLFDIHECDLAELFEAVTGYHVPPDDGMPQHLCYYCFSQLQRFSIFKQKCVRAHDILSSVALMDQHITTDFVRLIDRDAEGLSLSLHPHKVEIVDCEIIEQEPGTEDSEEKSDNVEENNENNENVEYYETEDYYKEPLTEDIQMQDLELKEAEMSIKEENHGTEEEGIEAPKFVAKNKKILKASDYPNIEIVVIPKEQQMVEFLARKESASYQSSAHKCPHCYKGYSNVIAFENHMLHHSEDNGSYECDICTMRFFTSLRLKVHQSNVHDKRYVCKLCKHTCSNSHKAILHQKNHAGAIYTCKYCNTLFGSPAACVAHVRKNHMSKVIFKNSHGVQDAVQYLQSKSKHKSDTIIYCNKCNEEFVGMDAHSKHITTSSRHTKDGNNFTFHCGRCGESFESRSLLGEHKAIYHVNSDITCPTCKVICNSHEELTLHCGEHHPNDSGEAKFVCEICGRKLTSSVKLLIHRKHHTMDKIYVCPYCQKAFKFAQYLQTHVRIHTGEKPYQCQLCPAAFQAKANLNRHLKVHTGDKPYMCDLCGKSFTQSNSMKMHVKTVHFKLPDPYKERRRFYNRQGKPQNIRLA